MDQGVPDPIRVDQVIIKVEKIDCNETQNFSGDKEIITKQEAVMYSEGEEDVDEEVLEECDVPINWEPDSLMLKDPLSIEDETLFKKDLVKEELISDICTNLPSVINPSSNPALPCGNHFKTPQHSKNLMFFLLNQQIFAIELPSDAIKDPSKVKLVFQPPSCNKPQHSEVAPRSPPPLTPISSHNKSYEKEWLQFFWLAPSSSYRRLFPPPDCLHFLVTIGIYSSLSLLAGRPLEFTSSSSADAKPSSLQMLLCSTERNMISKIMYLYKCHYCNERCKDKVELLHHMVESHRENHLTAIDSIPYVFKCIYCSGRCKTRLDLHKHMIETHYPKKLCGLFGSNSNVQTLHPLVTKKTPSVGLNFCHKPLFSSYNFSHTNVKDQKAVVAEMGTRSTIYPAQLSVTDYIFICYYCNGRSSNKEELEQHILQTHIPYLGGGCHQPTVPMPIMPRMIPKKQRKPRTRKERTIYECTYCSYAAPRPCMVKDHIAAKHTFEKPYKCELCDYRSSSKGLILGHMKSKHGRKRFKCDLCDYKAAQLCKVKYHIEAKHSKIKKYKCPHCDYRAVHAAGIRGHVVMQHEKHRIFHCPYCVYITRQAKGLQTHVLAKHTKDRPFRCQECEYGAVSARNLKYHMMAKHSHERPFPCHECSYKTISSNSLKKHIESKHLELKQYCCEHCDYKTSRPLVLKKHIQSKHLGEKPFQCYHCGYGTVWLGNLKLHIRSKHNKDRWYRCPYCYFRTFISKNLKTHIEVKHIHNGKLVFKPKRGRGRPRGSGKSCGTSRSGGISRKVQIDSEKVDISC